MQKIKLMIEELLETIDELSINSYDEAYDRYFTSVDWENTGADGLIRYTYNEETNEDEEYIQVQTDKKSTNYFYEVHDIIYKSNDTNTEKLKQLKQLEKTSRAENYFGYFNTKIKNKLLKVAIELNDSIDQPIIRLQRLKELEYKDIINTKDFEMLFDITERSQATYRTRVKKRLPYIGGGKGGIITYSKSKVMEWITKDMRVRN